MEEMRNGKKRNVIFLVCLHVLTAFGDLSELDIPGCPTELYCPDCKHVSQDAAMAVRMATCTEAPSQDSIKATLCAGQILDHQTRMHLVAGECESHCKTSSFPYPCASRRALLQTTPLPPTETRAAASEPTQAALPTQAQAFTPAPSLPVSQSSPFSEASPSPYAGATQSSTFWNCSGTIFNVRPYRSLWLAISDGQCTEDGSEQCAGMWISSAVYWAIQNGTCELLPCSQTATCAFGPSPMTGDAPGPGTSSAPAPAKQPAAATELSPCERVAYLCGSVGQYTVEKEQFDLVQSSPLCNDTGRRDSCVLATGAIDINLFGSIKSGTCNSACNTSSTSCVASASTPTSAPLTANVGGGDCRFTEFLCPGDMHVSNALYMAVSSAQDACSTDRCQTGGYTVSKDLWTSIQGGDCTRTCLQELPDCKQSEAIAPAPIGTMAAGFNLTKGAWSSCISQCSNETSYQTVTCRTNTTHLPVILDSCSYDLQSIQELSQSCGSSSCGEYAWQPGEWGECSAGCGRGTAWRDIFCTSRGQRVDNRYCAALSFPALTKPCYKRACSLATWKFSSWSTCSGSTQSRTVTCVNPDGSQADESECQTSVGYQASSSRPCNIFSCSKNEECSNNGVCSSGACQCFTGYTGASCNIAFGPCAPTPSPAVLSASPMSAPAPQPVLDLTPTSPLCCSTGVVDHQGRCCLSAVVAGSGYCCPVGSVLNNIGECCAPGKVLDACGACGSSGMAVDFLGSCCSGSLDAAGICCPPPLAVDDFGICGGTFTSAIVILTLEAATPGAVSNQAIAASIQSNVGVNASQTIFAAPSPGQAATGRRLLVTPASAAGGLTVVQLNASGTYLPLAKVLNSLLGPGNTSYLPAGIVVHQISAQGVTGNKICEIGDLTGSSRDCPLSFKAVPEGDDGPCNSRGNAIYSQGLCDCWTGYEGPDCSVCTSGYGSVNGNCMRTFVSFLGYYIPPAPAVSSAGLALPLSIAIVGVAVIFTVVSYLFIRKRRARSRQVQRPKDIQIPELEAQGNSEPDSKGTQHMSSSRSSQTRPQSAEESPTDRTSPLHTGPLAYLVNWLSQNAEAADSHSEDEHPHQHGGFDVFRTASDVGEIMDSHADMPTDLDRVNMELERAGRFRMGHFKFIQASSSKACKPRLHTNDRADKYQGQETPASGPCSMEVSQGYAEFLAQHADMVNQHEGRHEHTCSSSPVSSSFKNSPEAPQYHPVPEMHLPQRSPITDSLPEDGQTPNHSPSESSGTVTQEKILKLKGKRFWSGSDDGA